MKASHQTRPRVEKRTPSVDGSVESHCQPRACVLRWEVFLSISEALRCGVEASNFATADGSKNKVIVADHSGDGSLISFNSLNLPTAARISTLACTHFPLVLSISVVLVAELLISLVVNPQSTY